MPSVYYAGKNAVDVAADVIKEWLLSKIGKWRSETFQFMGLPEKS